MSFSLAANVVSASVARVLWDRQGDRALSEFCSKVDRMQNILSQQADGQWLERLTRESPLMDELLAILEWFEDWAVEAKQTGELTGMTPKEWGLQTISDKTLHDMRLAILGIVAPVLYFLAPGRIGAGRTLPQRRILQDPVEHHFGHVRGSNGDGNHPNADQCAAAGRRANTIRTHASGNTAKLPAEPQVHSLG